MSEITGILTLVFMIFTLNFFGLEEKWIYPIAVVCAFLSMIYSKLDLIFDEVKKGKK